jgi:hypothetical protein
LDSTDRSHRSSQLYEFAGNNEVDIAVDILPLNNEQSKTATGLETLWTALVNLTAAVATKNEDYALYLVHR